MRSTALDVPREVYRPFTAAECDALRHFLADVRCLGRMRFFEQVPKQASITHDCSGTRLEMDEPDDEAVRAAVTVFRQIYDPNEPTSASAVLRMLKVSANEHGGAKRDDALAALAELRKWANAELRRGIGMRIVFERGDTQDRVDPKRILDAYFHGYYLHSGNEKSELARLLDDLAPWGRYTLYSVMFNLARVYWVIANNVERILEDAALVVDPSADATSRPSL